MPKSAGSGSRREERKTVAPQDTGTRKTTLRFNHGNHTYYDGKRWMPSVTGITDRAEDKRSLIDWAAQQVATCAIEEAAELSRIRRLEGDEAAHDWLWQAANRYRDGRGVKGSDLHDVVDRKSSGQDVPEYLHDDIRRMADNAIAFLNDYQVQVLFSEVRLAHRLLGYCGTTDVIGIVPAYGSKPLIIDWKDLSLDTPIPTPYGWSTMGQLQVGDQVFDRDGQPVTVTAKSKVHHKDCYRITFRDGTSVVCSGGHRWVVETGYSPRNRAEQVMQTADMPANLRSEVTGQRHLRVPLSHPVDLPEVELPVDPYVLGCWLGDGFSGDAGICKPDDELFEHITARGYEVLPPRNSRGGKAQIRTVKGLSRQLRAAGLLNNKHIPPAYLRASIDQRLALLRGLMDTDGTANIARRGECSFTSVDKAFAYDVMELALSLGYPARINEINGHGFGKPVTSYDVTFRAVDHNPFLLTRKAERVGFVKDSMRHRMIVSVERTMTVPTQCIAVDSPTHTYLCTEKFIPTHNTAESMYRRSTFSRGKNSMQLAAYRGAEVMFWDDRTEADMIETDQAGLIVMIRPEGYKVEDFDLAQAWPQFERAIASYHWWRGAESLGRPARPPAIGPPPVTIEQPTEDLFALLAQVTTRDEANRLYQQHRGVWTPRHHEVVRAAVLKAEGAS